MIDRLLMPTAMFFLPRGVMGQKVALDHVHSSIEAPVTAGFATGLPISWGWVVVIHALGAVLIQNIVRIGNRPGVGQKETDQWHSDPANWVLGVFYYNKKDHRLFPPKRTYLGWTMNFANPSSIVAMVLVIVVLLMLIGLSKNWMS